MTLDASPEELAVRHGGMVRGIATSIAVELELTREIDDLVAFGFEGLFLAKKQFDPSRKIAFEAFAYHRVRGAVLDGVRGMMRLPRRALERCERMAAMNRAAEDAGEERARTPRREPEVDAVAEEVQTLLQRMTASLLATAVAAEEKRTNPEDAVLTQLEHARVRKAIDGLPQRERDCIRMLYFEEKTLDEVAAKLGPFSRARASQLHTRALAMLRESLGR